MEISISLLRKELKLDNDAMLKAISAQEKSLEQKAKELDKTVQERENIGQLFFHFILYFSVIYD